MQNASTYFIIGMAGSGKSTLVGQLKQHIKNAFVVNLDPAVLNVPYTPDVDIRDSVDYYALITDNKLGPNGAILTALNLFTSKLDQLLALLPTDRPILFDAPGQIESFVWSASGEILLNCFPEAALLYVADASRCIRPTAFVSSMLYMLSVVQRARIKRAVVVLNKTDLLSAKVPECYNQILTENGLSTDDATALDLLKLFPADTMALQDAFRVSDDTQAPFLNSAALYLDQFWQRQLFAFVSCKTREGFEDLMAKVEVALGEVGKDVRERREAQRLKLAEQAEAQAVRVAGELDEND